MKQLPYLDVAAAVRFGRRAVHPGPDLTGDEIVQVVADLRRASGRAPGHIAEVSGLGEAVPAATHVVDRATWVEAMAASAGAVLAALGAPTSPRGAFSRWRGQVFGAQTGGVLAVVATRILGQFDPFTEPGRLLLVAPNVVAVERSLGVLPSDFRLWVCLHEQTHSAQFAAAPWLREHLLGQLRRVLEDEEPPTGEPGHTRGLAHLVGGGDAFDQVTAVMSLLEGHADVMMDRVGTAVVPTLPRIRTAFEARRDRSGFPALVSKLFGLDLKRAQYRDGAAFCTGVLERAGVEVLNRAFLGPEALPSLAEIHDPQRWLQRVG